MTVVWHALTRRSKGQRSRSRGYENCYGRMAPTWDRTSFDCLCFLVMHVMCFGQNVLSYLEQGYCISEHIIFYSCYPHWCYLRHE